MPSAHAKSRGCGSGGKQVEEEEEEECFGV